MPGSVALAGHAEAVLPLGETWPDGGANDEWRSCVNSQDFEFVSQLLRKRAGIVLTGDKMYLLESRLAPLARKEGLPSIDDPHPRSCVRPPRRAPDRASLST